MENELRTLQARHSELLGNTNNTHTSTTNNNSNSPNDTLSTTANKSIQDNANTNTTMNTHTTLNNKYNYNTASSTTRENGNSSTTSNNDRHKQVRIAELEYQLEEKDLLISQLREQLTRDKTNKKLYEEGKDELIFELEQKLSNARETLNKQATTIKQLQYESINTSHSNSNAEEQKRYISSLSLKLETTAKELEKLRDRTAQKEIYINELEGKLKADKSLSEFSQSKYLSMLEEKDKLIAQLKKDNDENIEELAIERAKWSTYQDSERDILKELENELEKAALSLEQERNRRTELESILERTLSNQQRQLKRTEEDQREQWMKRVEELERENKAVWGERDKMAEELEEKHRELVEAIKGGEEKKERDEDLISSLKKEVQSFKVFRISLSLHLYISISISIVE